MKKKNYVAPLILLSYILCEDAIRTSGAEDVGVDGEKQNDWWKIGTI